MTAVRAVLVAITILVLAVAPMVVPNVTGSPGDQAAYAAPADSPSLQNDNDDNDNTITTNAGDDNDNDGDDGDDNGNGNDNDDGDDDNGNGNDNDGDDNDNEDVPAPILVGQPGVTAVGPTGARGLQSVTGVTKCFDVQEVGLVQRAIGEGDVTVAVPPDSGFTSVTRLTLDAVPATSVPAPPGGTSVLDALVFRLSALDGCAGAPIVQLSGGVNLGITYRVQADKSRLQIVMLQNDQWVNVTTVPDPTNPYISATIQSAGTYAVIQR